MTLKAEFAQLPEQLCLFYYLRLDGDFCQGETNSGGAYSSMNLYFFAIPTFLRLA